MILTIPSNITKLSNFTLLKKIRNTQNVCKYFYYLQYDFVGVGVKVVGHGC